MAAIVHTAGAVLENEQRCVNCGAVLLDDVLDIGGGFEVGDRVGASAVNNNTLILYRLRRNSLNVNETLCQSVSEV
jgi:hypothetical protein